MRVLRVSAAFVPLACLLAFVVFVGIATVRGGGDPTGNAVLPDGVTRALLIAVAAGWLAVPLYVRHAHENDALRRYERKRWLFGLRLYPPLAMPVYGWRYLR
jgi:uncharacterized membrane protein SpoIIM required for sporulation